MEKFSNPEVSEFEYAFSSAAQPDLAEVMPSPEAYPGCLVEAMQAVNSGNTDARAVIESTVIARRSNDLALACGRCGIAMVRDNNIVYGAAACEQVKAGRLKLGELA